MDLRLTSNSSGPVTLLGLIILQNTEIRVPLVLAQLASVGAPVIETYPDQINTDGYSDDAPGAVELPRKLMAA